VLVLLFVAMAAVTTPHDPNEITLILLFGALQLSESILLPSLGRQRARVMLNLGKVAVAYALIGYTHGIESDYYWMLLFPVISTAAALGVGSTLVFTVVACAAYLSFLHPVFVNYTQLGLDDQAKAELVRRVLFLGISGMLVNILAQALRSQSHRYQLLAEELEASNRSLREAEAQVRRAERLAAIGQLTAGLAHELRNPLGTIKASADMLERNLPAGDAIAQELAGYISSEVDRTNSLVSRFLDFARPLEIRRSRADLNDVVAAAIAAARRDASQSGVAMDFRPSAKSIVFPIDAELMERVFFNLILNAIQASPAGGTVRVETTLEETDACVSVTDRGHGIAPDQRESIFNPFFTTKASGTGLGLAIVAKIVGEHRGKIDVESKPGEGSTFRVCLPTEQAQRDQT
jgi:signal transduction histidine kinase